mgnify:CR=1 FL=1
MKKMQVLQTVTIRFAGDSGDGMQLVGDQFTVAVALAGNNLLTLPDYPSEIRAPAGTLFGVSGFQIQFSSGSVHTPGDTLDVLVAMNPAALQVNLKQMKNNGIIIVNTDAFNERNLELAQYGSNPLKDNLLDGYQVFQVPIASLNREALKESSLSLKAKNRSRNFFALGIAYWMFNCSLDNTLNWIESKFESKPDLIDANKKALHAGYDYALSAEDFSTYYKVEKANKRPGKYRNITGNKAVALGMITAARKADKKLFLGSYPITPASDILHELSKHHNFDVITFQAEDEIAGVGSALGASYAGALGVTTTSAPGMSLKSEFTGFAVMAELPLVIINVQRSGPSTGMPTKTEQADLLQSLYGRGGEAPVPVIAAASATDCFKATFEACRIALEFATPVILLSDEYIANGAEPWLIPNLEEVPEIEVKCATNPENYQPYERDPKTLARMMALPGTPGLEHCIGGLEKEDVSGNVSYDPENHDRMVRLRDKKVRTIADYVDDPEICGEPEGDLLVISWGSTYGSVFTAMEEIQNRGLKVSWYHLRWIHPLPQNLGGYIKNFNKVLIPEINLGQLIKIIRSEYLVDAKGFNSVRGLPLRVSDIIEAIEAQLEG